MPNKQMKNNAPRKAMIAGEPHMLAYINEAERQMLKRAGGAEMPSFAGIPAYPPNRQSGAGANVSPSRPTKKKESLADKRRRKEREAAAASNTLYQTLANFITPNDGTTYVGGTLMNDYEGPNIDGSSGYAVDNANNSGSGNAFTYGGGSISDAGKTITYPNDGQVTLAGQQAAFTDPNYNLNNSNLIQAVEDNGTYVRDNTVTTTSTPGGGSTPTVKEVNQALLDALALRDAALARQLGLLNEQFTFATDDYYNQLGTNYREGGLSDAFTTAYDDATRGIYDTFKSAGMLTQQGVDDKLGILAGAESGEEGRIDSIVDQYMGANRNYVTGGKSDLTSELQGLAVDSEDIPTINAQTAAINAFDVVGRSKPYKEPKEQEVVDFFTDFVKRAYDPSYNVDPSAVATGAPKRVTGSVNQKGANTAPSTIAGLFDPVTGGSVKVVN